MKKLSLILYTFLLSTSLLLAQQAAECEENVDATSETEVVSNTLQASNTLTVNRKLAAGDTLRLIGGQVIELLPGFEADYGSVVEGENGECVDLNVECFEPCQTIGLLITQNEECFYEWQNEDVTSEDKNSPQIEVCPKETTTYTLKIVRTDGSIEERTYEVKIFDLSFKEDPYYLCEGENEVKLELNNPTKGYTYEWSDTENGNVLGTGPNYTATSIGTYYVTVSDPCGNTYSESISVQTAITPNITILTPDPSICATPPEANLNLNLQKSADCAIGTAILEVGGGGTYEWSNGSTNSTATVTTSGEYSVTVTNEQGCSSTETVSVQDCDPVEINPQNPILCPGGEVVLTATDGFDEYMWTNPDGEPFFSGMSDPNTIRVSVAGVYTVKATKTDSDCLPSTASVTVTEFALPLPTITANPTPPIICNGVPVTLTAQGDFDTWQWQKEGSDIASANNTTYDALEVGEYTVKGFKGDCMETSEPIVVTEIEAEVDLVAHKPPVIDSRETVVSDEKGMTFVNLDNDDVNGDFDNTSNNIAGGDNELFKIKLKLKTDNAKKTVQLNATGDAGAVRVYESNDKTISYALGTDIALTNMEGGYYVKDMWVEGVSPHTAPGATQLELKYTVDGCEVNDIVDVTIVGIDNMTWRGIGGNIPAAHPDRVYTGAAAPIPMGASRQAVDLIVNLTVAPVCSLKIYVKAFDIDDPSAETDFIDPNDDPANHTGTMKYKGNAGLVYTPDEDNRAADKDATMTGEDGNGVAAINFPAGSIQESIQFTDLSMHPGDNYKVAANGDRDFLPQLRNLDHTDFADIFERNVGGNGAVVQFPNNYTSPILTVWRLLHVEYDSMDDYNWRANSNGNYLFIDRATDFEGGSSNSVRRLIFRNSRIVDSEVRQSPFLPIRNGRFDNGTVTIAPITLPDGSSGTGPNSVEINNILGNGEDFVEFNAPINLIPVGGLQGEIVNNIGNIIVATVNTFSKFDIPPTPTEYDWEVTISGVADISLISGELIGGTISIANGSRLTINDVVSPNIIKTSSFSILLSVKDDDRPSNGLMGNNAADLNALNSFGDAYIQWTPDGGGNNVNNNTIPFFGNIISATELNSIENNRGSKNSESDEFWVAYVIKCWQSGFRNDVDPDFGESVLWGSTRSEVVAGCALSTSNVDVNRGMNNSMFFAEVYHDFNPPSGASLSEVIAHEVGHQFGLDHGTIPTTDPATGCTNGDSGNPDPAIPAGELNNWGLMSAGGAAGGYSPNFNDRHLNLLRSRTTSPGN